MPPYTVFDNLEALSTLDLLDEETQDRVLKREALHASLDASLSHAIPDGHDLWCTYLHTWAQTREKLLGDVLYAIPYDRTNPGVVHALSLSQPFTETQLAAADGIVAVLDDANPRLLPAEVGGRPVLVRVDHP